MGSTNVSADLLIILMAKDMTVFIHLKKKLIFKQPIMELMGNPLNGKNISTRIIWERSTY
jgi:hypothetical protein